MTQKDPQRLFQTNFVLETPFNQIHYIRRRPIAASQKQHVRCVARASALIKGQQNNHSLLLFPKLCPRRAQTVSSAPSVFSSLFQIELLAAICTSASLAHLNSPLIFLFLFSFLSLVKVGQWTHFFFFKAQRSDRQSPHSLSWERKTTAKNFWNQSEWLTLATWLTPGFSSYNHLVKSLLTAFRRERPSLTEQTFFYWLFSNWPVGRLCAVGAALASCHRAAVSRGGV